MRLIYVGMFIFGFVGSSMTERQRFTWDSPKFGFCGYPLFNHVAILCDWKIKHHPINYKHMGDECCSTACTLREMKCAYCENCTVDTEFPIFSGLANDTQWNYLMNLTKLYGSDINLQGPPRSLGVYLRASFINFFGRRWPFANEGEYA